MEGLLTTIKNVMILTKVISGGQTGADQAGLHAAERVGITTGGWAPKGWWTSEGPQEELLRSFGLREAHGGYHERTVLNVADSDGTIALAYNWNSAGEILTYNTCKKLHKPIYLIDLEIYSPLDVPMDVEFILRNHISILNIAGNRQGIRIDVFNKALEILVDLFTRVKEVTREGEDYQAGHSKEG